MESFSRRQNFFDHFVENLRRRLTTLFAHFFRTAPFPSTAVVRRTISQASLSVDRRSLLPIYIRFCLLYELCESNRCLGENLEHKKLFVTYGRPYTEKVDQIRFPFTAWTGIDARLPSGSIAGKSKSFSSTTSNSGLASSYPDPKNCNYRIQI
uniref:Uncharacterized protein n=1 Tax=Romanomermis culicivorax TaxID=13658 RepID=A0A915HIG4_ROMCU